MVTNTQFDCSTKGKPLRVAGEDDINQGCKVVGYTRWFSNFIRHTKTITELSLLRICLRIAIDIHVKVEIANSEQFVSDVKQ